MSVDVGDGAVGLPYVTRFLSREQIDDLVGTRVIGELEGTGLGHLKCMYIA
jgi:hypothetical protein